MAGTDPIMAVLVFAVIGVLIYMHFTKKSFREVWEKLKGG